MDDGRGLVVTTVLLIRKMPLPRPRKLGSSLLVMEPHGVADGVLIFDRFVL